jgi:hypothetical protein
MAKKQQMQMRWTSPFKGFRLTSAIQSWHLMPLRNEINRHQVFSNIVANGEPWKVVM